MEDDVVRVYGGGLGKVGSLLKWYGAVGEGGFWGGEWDEMVFYRDWVVVSICLDFEVLGVLWS